MTRYSILNLKDAEAGPAEQGRVPASALSGLCEPPVESSRFPPRSRSRAAPPFCRGLPARTPPLPSRSLRPVAALTSALWRAGLSSPRPLPRPRSLRSRGGQPHLVFTSRLGEKPPPPGTWPLRSLPLFAELPLLQVASASPCLCLSCPVPTDPGPPGDRPGSVVASGQGEAECRGSGGVTDTSTGQSHSPLLAVLHRRSQGKKTSPHLEAQVVWTWLSSQGILLAVLVCWRFLHFRTGVCVAQELFAG